MGKTNRIGKGLDFMFEGLEMAGSPIEIGVITLDSAVGE